MSEIGKKIKEEKNKAAIQEVENESSSGSDSGCSEDNLDAEELLKLMPKRAVKKRAGQGKKKKAASRKLNIQKKQM